METILNQKPTRVLIITQWFDPEPIFKGLIFAKELVRQGFEVEVVTGFPNYPSGKLYPGYKIKLIKRETLDGVKVTRVPLYPSHDSNKLHRVANYLSFAFSVLIYGLFFAKRADVIYTYHPPLTVGIAAGLIRFLRRIPLVYDIQDIWPDTLRASGVVTNEKFLRVVGWLCNWVYNRADKIAVLSPGFKQLLIERKVRADKIEVIYNWCQERQLLKPLGTLPTNFPGNDKFRILFAGNMGKAQALDAVLNAAAILQKTNASHIMFIFLGTGLETCRLKQLALDMKLENTCFLPPVPINEVGNMLSAADVLLVHLKNDPLFAITIPSKTQAYMAIGKPVLMAVNGDAATLIQASASGKVATSEDPESIALTALEMSNMPKEELQKMAELGQKFYTEKLSLAIGVAKFGKIFNGLVPHKL